MDNIKMFFSECQNEFISAQKKSKVMMFFSRVLRLPRITFCIMLQLRRIKQFIELLIFSLVYNKIRSSVDKYIVTLTDISKVIA